MAIVSDDILKEYLYKVNSLQNQLYTMGYKKTLPNVLSYTIQPSIHRMNQIKGYNFFSPTGEQVEICFKLLPDKTVQIDSNVSLLNSIIILY